MSESHRLDKQRRGESEADDESPSPAPEAVDGGAADPGEAGEGSPSQATPADAEPAQSTQPEGGVDEAHTATAAGDPGADEGATQAAGETGTETSSAEHERDASDEAPPAPPAGPRSGGGEHSGGGGRRGRWRALALALVVLVLVVAGGGGYLYWRLQQLEQRVAAVPEERERALERFARSEALAQSIDELESQVTGEAQRLEKAIDEVAQSDTQRAQTLRERLDKLEQAVATARELAGRDQLDWRLAEVHYLVAVAARRLAIAHDRRAAIAAMEAADRSLAEVGDVRLLDLRQRLVDAISALHQTEPADVEGIAVRIQSLLQRIPDLPPRQQREPADDGAEGTTADAGSWWQRLREGLSSYVVVRRQGEPEGPARPRADRALPAAEKLGYALSEARRAALRREPDPYSQSIQRARAIVDEHFAADSPTVAYFRETLDELEERGVTTSYPDLTRTLDYVEEVTAELEARRDRPDLVGADGED